VDRKVKPEKKDAFSNLSGFMDRASLSSEYFELTGTVKSSDFIIQLSLTYYIGCPKIM